MIVSSRRGGREGGRERERSQCCYIFTTYPTFVCMWIGGYMSLQSHKTKGCHVKIGSTKMCPRATQTNQHVNPSNSPIWLTPHTILVTETEQTRTCCINMGKLLSKTKQTSENITRSTSLRSTCWPQKDVSGANNSSKMDTRYLSSLKVLNVAVDFLRHCNKLYKRVYTHVCMRAHARVGVCVWVHVFMHIKL